MMIEFNSNDYINFRCNRYQKEHPEAFEINGLRNDIKELTKQVTRIADMLEKIGGVKNGAH